MKLRFTHQARRDIDSLFQHIVQDNPTAAQQILDWVEAMIDHLPHHSYLGRIGRVSDTRELVVPRTSYIVAYKIKAHFINILAIIHGTRKWPNQL